MRARVMMEAAPVRVLSFLLLVACGALCQERQQKPAWNSLPDAPSVQVSTQEIFPMFADEAHLLAPESGQANPSRTAWTNFEVRGGEDESQEKLGLVEKYLYPSLLKRNPSFHPSTSESFLGRAADAASRILVTRDDSGKQRLNTSYLVEMLSSAAIHTAYRPYWRRSVSEPFSDFGSNIGNDAGMNLLHEFGPGLQQLMKSHAPKFVAKTFVAKIEGHISHN